MAEIRMDSEYKEFIPYNSTFVIGSTSMFNRSFTLTCVVFAEKTYPEHIQPETTNTAKVEIGIITTLGILLCFTIIEKNRRKKNE